VKPARAWASLASAMSCIASSIAAQAASNAAWAAACARASLPRHGPQSPRFAPRATRSWIRLSARRQLTRRRPPAHSKTALPDEAHSKTTQAGILSVLVLFRLGPAFFLCTYFGESSMLPLYLPA
jgi:hypothetical protein